MTCNDLKLNELLVRAAMLQPVVSQYVREGRLRNAAEKASEFTEVVRSLDWRIQELLTKESR